MHAFTLLHSWAMESCCSALTYTELFCLCHFQGDEEEEETDNLVNQVLDEIGINLDEQMVAAPGQKVQVCDHISLSIFNPLVAMPNTSIFERAMDTL